MVLSPTWCRLGDMHGLVLDGQLYQLGLATVNTQTEFAVLVYRKRRRIDVRGNAHVSRAVRGW